MVTLFRDQRQEEYDNKDWFFILEDVKVPVPMSFLTGKQNE